MYEELIHIPFFIYDPRNPIQGERRNQLAQTIDIVPTLAEFFQIAPPEYMDGHSLTPVIRNDTPIRDYALFGIFGGHICITDGRYVYMRSCKDPEISHYMNILLCLAIWIGLFPGRNVRSRTL